MILWYFCDIQTNITFLVYHYRRLWLPPHMWYWSADSQQMPDTIGFIFLPQTGCLLIKVRLKNPQTTQSGLKPCLVLSHFKWVLLTTSHHLSTTCLNTPKDLQAQFESPALWLGVAPKPAVTLQSAPLALYCWFSLLLGGTHQCEHRTPGSPVIFAEYGGRREEMRAKEWGFIYPTNTDHTAKQTAARGDKEGLRTETNIFCKLWERLNTMKSHSSWWGGSWEQEEGALRHMRSADYHFSILTLRTRKPQSFITCHLASVGGQGGGRGEERKKNKKIPQG